jgi:chromosomal replication initiation ATPase DnaA
MNIKEASEKIEKKVQEKTGIAPHVIRGKHRDREYIIARHMVWRWLNRNGFTFAEIGRFYNRDHTTIFHACRKVRP